MSSIVNYPLSLEGLASAYVGFPQTIGQALADGELAQIVLRRTDDTSNLTTVAFKKAGAALRTVSIDPLASEIIETYSTPRTTIASGETITAEVTGTPSGMNLNGYVSIEYGDAIAPTPQPDDLTTLGRVKAFLGLSDSTFDTYLTQLITDVSARMQEWMERKIHGEVVTGEKLDAIGEWEVQVRGFPVVSVESLKVYGDALAAEDYTFDAATGILRRTTSDGYSMRWPYARHAIEVDYTYGYAEVPRDLQNAADLQVAWEFGLSSQGDKGRLGLEGSALPQGGTSAYIPNLLDARGWVPQVLDVMARYERLPEPV